MHIISRWFYLSCFIMVLFIVSILANALANSSKKITWLPSDHLISQF